MSLLQKEFHFQHFFRITNILLNENSMSLISRTQARVMKIFERIVAASFTVTRADQRDREREREGERERGRENDDENVYDRINQAG